MFFFKMQTYLLKNENVTVATCFCVNMTYSELYFCCYSLLCFHTTLIPAADTFVSNVRMVLVAIIVAIKTRIY
jgi:hypothetical protein